MPIPRTAKRRLRMGLAALLLAVAARPAEACSLTGVRASRDPAATHLVAVPTGRTVRAGAGLPRYLKRAERQRDWREGMYSPRHRQWWRLQVRRAGRRVRELFRPPAPYGQVVTLERVGGAGDARVRAALARSRGQAVLVRWDLGASCGPVLREEAEPWLRPGARVFLTARLRSPRGWVGGRPTFDVLASDYPYPLSARLLRGPMPREEPLPLETMWSLYEALPLGYQPADTAAAVARLDAWARAHPAAARHPDARLQLEVARSSLFPYDLRGTEIESRSPAVRTSTPDRNTDGAPGQQEARARQGGQRP